MSIHNRFRMLAFASLAFAGACADSPRTITETDGATLRVQHAVLSQIAALGQDLFEDQNLSVNRNQSCRTCHEPSEGFAAPLVGVTTQGSVVHGSVNETTFGNRKPPSAAYATFSPLFSVTGGSANGGNFWDGRATGEILGSPTADQALGPFLNPKEQALPDAACVIYRIANGAYLADYTAVWGSEITTISFPASTDNNCSNGVPIVLSAPDRAKVETAYHNVGNSIKEFELSFNKFSSRVDANDLTALEREGAKLFNGKGKCHQCHGSGGAPDLFTDFKYHNAGVPKNPNSPAFSYGTLDFDMGLGGFTGRTAHIGKFKTPTVRDAALGSNRTYMHNGVLTSVKQVVDFYNTRDLLRVCTPSEINTLVPSQYGVFGGANCWPPPEYAATMDTKQMGNLGLTEHQVDAIVAFINALTDN